MVLYKSLGRKGGVSTRLQKTSEDHLFHAAPVVQHWAKVHVVHCPISRLLRKTTRPKWGWKFIGHPKPFRRDISGLFVLDWRHHPAIFLQQLCTECTWCACENAPSVRVWRALHNLFFFSLLCPRRILSFAHPSRSFAAKGTHGSLTQLGAYTASRLH